MKKAKVNGLPTSDICEVLNERMELEIAELREKYKEAIVAAKLLNEFMVNFPGPKKVAAAGKKPKRSGKGIPVGSKKFSVFRSGILLGAVFAANEAAAYLRAAKKYDWPASSFKLYPWHRDE